MAKISNFTEQEIEELQSSFEYPKHWKIEPAHIAFNEVRDGTHDSPKKVEDGIPLVTSKNLKNGKIDRTKLTYISEEDHRDISKRSKVNQGDILFSMIGTIGNTCLVKEHPDFSIKNVALFRSNDEKVFPKFGYYWLSSKTFQSFLESKQRGGNQKFLSLGVLRVSPVVIPPIVEQRRIADKLDSVLAKVEAAQARLDKIPAILKRFRQSVLAAATSGGLTKDWREELHEAFQRVTLGNAGITVKTGPFGSALHKSEYVVSGIPVVNPTHINEGRISTSENMTITPDKFEELKSWKLSIGDVIVGRRGEMGRAAEIKKEHPPMLCGTGSMILKTDESYISPAFLTIALRSPTAIQFFESNSVGSTMVNLNQKIIKAFEIYYSSEDEQAEIVSRVDALFEHANTVEKQYGAAKARLDKLTQSILSKAFKGELLTNTIDTNISEIENSVEALNA